jgi:hypothetical protein
LLGIINQTPLDAIFTQIPYNSKLYPIHTRWSPSWPENVNVAVATRLSVNAWASITSAYSLARTSQFSKCLRQSKKFSLRIARCTTRNTKKPLKKFSGFLFFDGAMFQLQGVSHFSSSSAQNYQFAIINSLEIHAGFAIFIDADNASTN